MSAATRSSGTAFAIGRQFAVATHCVRPNEIVRYPSPGVAASTPPDGVTRAAASRQTDAIRRPRITAAYGVGLASAPAGWLPSRSMLAGGVVLSEQSSRRGA